MFPKSTKQFKRIAREPAPDVVAAHARVKIVKADAFDLNSYTFRYSAGTGTDDVYKHTLYAVTASWWEDEICTSWTPPVKHDAV